MYTVTVSQPGQGTYSCSYETPPSAARTSAAAVVAVVHGSVSDLT